MKFVGLTDGYGIVAEKLSKKLCLSKIDMTVRFTERDEMTVGVKDGEGYIRCGKKHHFARLLGLLCCHVGEGDFEICEKSYFETLSCMMDVSSGAPLTVESIYEYLDTLALNGYNQVLFYVEDMYEIEENPYFGYLRGRYTYGELKAIDDYAFELGIEMVACMQTLGHLASYLVWPEAAHLRENNMVLLPDSDRTYEFIERMIVNSTRAFRSRRIHIGCDEAHGVGRGNYLKNHPLTPQIDVFIDHVNRVCEICKRHGLKPMLWHDMIFALSSASYSNYDRRVIISDRMKNELDPELEIVMWHYGQVPGCEEFMIDKFREMGKDIIFAGASCIWKGPLPDNYFSSKVTEISLRICKEKGIREVCVTVWAYDSKIYQMGYLDVCRYGELAYNGGAESLRERFEFITGISYDAMMRMSDINDLYNTPEAIADPGYDKCSRGNRYYLCDLTVNVMERDMLETPRSSYYRSAAEYLQPFAEKAVGTSLDYFYSYAYEIFALMAVKCEIIENLGPAYSRGDRETLRKILNQELPEYLTHLESLSLAHGAHKDRYLKAYGGEKYDIFYGSRKERAKVVMRRLRGYLDGALDSLQELEGERLKYNGGPIFPIR